MRELILDGNNWKTRDDVYNAFFAAVGSPSWHGKNLDALNDSIATGNINAIEVPYRVVIKDFDLVTGKAAIMARDFTDLILEIAARECPVEIELRDSHGAVLPSIHSQSKESI